MKHNTLNPDKEYKKWKIIVEDASVTGIITFISGLLAKGYPPSIEVLYISGLNALLVGLYSYARLRGFKR